MERILCEAGRKNKTPESISAVRSLVYVSDFEFRGYYNASVVATFSATGAAGVPAVLRVIGVT